MSKLFQDGVLVRQERLPEITIELWAHDLVDNENIDATLSISNGHNATYLFPLGNMFIRPQPKVTTLFGRTYIVYWERSALPRLAVYDIAEGQLCVASTLIKEEATNKGTWYHFSDEFCGDTAVLFSTDANDFTIIREAEL